MQVSDLIDDIKRSLGLASDVELAKRLGVAAVTVASWKKRNSVGTLLEHLIQNQTPVSIDRLLHQEGNYNAGVIINQGVGDAELQRLLRAALELSTPEEIKQVIRDHIKKCAG